MSKREVIEPQLGDKRYIRRDDKGRIVESTDVGRSLAKDVKTNPRSTSNKGEADKGDRKVSESAACGRPDS